MEKMALIYSTFSTQEEAKSVLKTLMDEGLATCGNIFAPHLAIYPWEGEICEESEVAVLFKASHETEKDMIAKLREIHPYTLPCIIALDAKTLPDYARWLRAC